LHVRGHAVEDAIDEGMLRGAGQHRVVHPAERIGPHHEREPLAQPGQRDQALGVVHVAINTAQLLEYQHAQQVRSHCHAFGGVEHPPELRPAGGRVADQGRDVIRRMDLEPPLERPLGPLPRRLVRELPAQIVEIDPQVDVEPRIVPEPGGHHPHQRAIEGGLAVGVVQPDPVDMARDRPAWRCRGMAGQQRL